MKRKNNTSPKQKWADQHEKKQKPTDSPVDSPTFKWLEVFCEEQSKKQGSPKTKHLAAPSTPFAPISGYSSPEDVRPEALAYHRGVEQRARAIRAMSEEEKDRRGLSIPRL